MDSVFHTLSKELSLPIDKVRYVVLFFASYPLAFLFRLGLHYSSTSSSVRHIYSTVFGLYFGWLCFRWQLFYLVAFVGIGYLLLLMLPHRIVEKYSMIYALVVISIGHIYRMITDYGGFHLDFTGPLMLMVQKVTYVAFEYHDGVARKDNELSDDQRRQKIIAVPSLLEYFSYNFCFFTFLAGPTSTYKEYDDFITGRNMTSAKKKILADPSPLIPLLKKLACALVYLVIYVSNLNWIDYNLILDPSLPLFPTRFVNIQIFCFVDRSKYFFSHLIVESICNAGGLGFNGYDQKGNAKWDLIKNLDVVKMELGKNPREQVAGLNITTTNWLRRVVYERTHWNPVLLTFIVSAIWHGFYPGYYVAFVYIAMLTIAARKIRRLIWHYFQSPPLLKLSYDIVTVLTTILLRTLAQLSFVLLLWDDIVLIWSYFYYLPVIPLLFVVFVLPDKKTEKTKQQAVNGSSPDITRPHQD